MKGNPLLITDCTQDFMPNLSGFSILSCSKITSHCNTLTIRANPFNCDKTLKKWVTSFSPALLENKNLNSPNKVPKWSEWFTTSMAFAEKPESILCERMREFVQCQSGKNDWIPRLYFVPLSLSFYIAAHSIIWTIWTFSPCFCSNLHRSFGYGSWNRALTAADPL
jgi:hypothetical protein